MTPAVTSRQSSQDVPHASVKHLPPSKHGQDRLPDRYNYDNSFCTTRDALVHTKVRKYFPDTASSRASSPRTTQSRTRDLSPLQGLPPQPICSQRFRTDQKRTLLRELRTIRIFRYISPSLRFDNPAALPRQPLRRVSRLHRKRTPRQHSTRLLQMRRRLRRPSRVRLPTPQEPIRHDTEPPSLVSTLVHNLHFIRPTESCHRRVRTRQVREQQEIQAVTTQDKPERSGKAHRTSAYQDRICPDYPHDTAILIVVTSLSFTTI